MTIIVDDTGTRWVEPVERVKRKPGKRRFEGVQVGDFVMKHYVRKGRRKTDPPGSEHVELSRHTEYAVVTDLWFDPVKGQHDRERGEMVAIRMIMRGREYGDKVPHTIRGLGTNGYLKADRDPIAQHQTVQDAKTAGQVVGIGHGLVIRRRPRIAGVC